MSATLDSRPSASQTSVRRLRHTQSRMAFGESCAGARPAPMPECRQAAVGPNMNVAATATSAMTADRREKTTAVTASRTTTSRHVPGAVRSGRSPKPPAREPAIAPAVFQA